MVKNGQSLLQNYLKKYHFGRKIQFLVLKSILVKLPFRPKIKLNLETIIFDKKVWSQSKNTIFCQKYHLGRTGLFSAENIFVKPWIKILKNFESKSTFRQIDDFRGYTFEWIWHEFSRNDTYSRIFLNNVILIFWPLKTFNLLLKFISVPNGWPN